MAVVVPKWSSPPAPAACILEMPSLSGLGSHSLWPYFCFFVFIYLRKKNFYPRKLASIGLFPGDQYSKIDSAHHRFQRITVSEYEWLSICFQSGWKHWTVHFLFVHFSSSRGPSAEFSSYKTCIYNGDCMNNCEGLRWKLDHLVSTASSNKWLKTTDAEELSFTL